MQKAPTNLEEWIVVFEEQFNDTLNDYIPKSKLKLVQSPFNYEIRNIKHLNYDFSHFTNKDEIDIQKDKWIKANHTYENNWFTKKMFSDILSNLITLPQMNVDRLYVEYSYLIEALFQKSLCTLEQKAQERLKELNN
jgi:hypothetical protein